MCWWRGVMWEQQAIKKFHLTAQWCDRQRPRSVPLNLDPPLSLTSSLGTRVILIRNTEGIWIKPKTGDGDKPQNPKNLIIISGCLAVSYGRGAGTTRRRLRSRLRSLWFFHRSFVGKCRRLWRRQYTGRRRRRLPDLSQPERAGQSASVSVRLPWHHQVRPPGMSSAVA